MTLLVVEGKKSQHNQLLKMGTDGCLCWEQWARIDLKTWMPSWCFKRGSSFAKEISVHFRRWVLIFFFLVDFRLTEE